MKQHGFHKKMTDIFPMYAIWLAIGMLLVNGVVYFGTRLITDPMKHHDMSGFLDYQLPFLPVFIIPYMLAYVQWVIGFAVIAMQERAFCYKYMVGEIISEVIAGVMFLLIPTTMLRGEITGSDVCSRVVALLYRYDAATNLFPSIHCLESYICLKAVTEMKNLDKRFRAGMIIMSVLVFMSTMFIKQHVILDFFGAVIVAEAGWLAYGMFRERGIFASKKMDFEA